MAKYYGIPFTEQQLEAYRRYKQMKEMQELYFK